MVRTLSAVPLVLAMTAAPAMAEDTRVFDNGDIIVTARKREERAIDIPLAVTAVDGKALERRGAANLSDFLQEAPGVGIYDGGAALGTRITIRGISTSLGANENGYYLDDLPFTGVTVPLSPDVRAWDLERVEVLRGPQGTLFGEGSMGGTVRIITRGADLDNWEAKGLGVVSVTRGGGTNAGAKGAFNAPIVPGVLAVRVAGTHERYQGWIDDSFTGRVNVNDQTYDTFRARARFDPTDRLSITGNYWLMKGDFPGGGSAAQDNGQQSLGLVPSSRNRMKLYGATARYDLNGASLFYSYTHGVFQIAQQGLSSRGSIDVGIGIDVDAHELRMSSTDAGPLAWTVGAYARNSRRDDAVQFAAMGIDNVAAITTRARALFGEGTYTLAGGAIDLTAGLRYFEDRLRGSEANSGQVTVQPGGDYSSWNPRFAISWHPRADATIYASAAKGFRSGQLQPTVPLLLGQLYGLDLPAALKQDDIWTYEVGAKAEVLNRMVKVEAALFYSDWRDVAVRIPIPGTGFNGQINSKGTHTKGAEFSLEARPLAGLSLAASGAYIDAYYVAAVPGTGIVKGSPVEEVAKFTANASVEYAHAIGAESQAFGRIGWQHASPRSNASFPSFRPGDTIDRIDARFGVAIESMTIAVFADNLTDENGATSFRQVQQFGPTLYDITSNRLRPRTLGVELSFGFGGPAR